MDPSKGRRKSLRIGAILATLAWGAGAGTACARRDPPSWDAGSGSLSVSPLPPPGTGPTSQDGSSAPSAPVHEGGGAATPGAPGDASGGAGDEAAPAVDPGTLPQTRDRPRSSDPAFAARAKALWDAIVADDPDVATPAFFPVEAYKQVKAIASPEVDHKRRLLAAFARDIHRMHERLEAGPGHASGATFVELDVPSERARWVDPGEESNKIGYWRVYGTKLRYQAAGRPSTFDVASLISWRGEWYVVHLAGFK